MKNRRYLGMEEEDVIPMLDQNGGDGTYYSKIARSPRMPYRKATKVAVFVLLIILMYAFLSLIFHLRGLTSPFPAYDPRPINLPTEAGDGSLIYQLAVVTDLDHDSKTADSHWRSYMRRGRLVVPSDWSKVSVDWDKKQDISLQSDISTGGRAMELSDLVVFDRHLLTVDDRTGIVYRVQPPMGDSLVVPWLILADGPGNVTKPLKGEWMTVKDQHLYIGGLGKEWTNEKGEYINDHPMWVKRVDSAGRVEHLPWVEIYKEVRRALGIEFPGYLVHEAVQFSHVHRKWFFLPRRVSHEIYNEEADEGRGSNILIIADEFFSSIEVVRIGKSNSPSPKGFSAFQFVPSTGDGLIVALKSEEKDGHPVGSFITVFDIQGNVFLPDQPLSGAYKFEGLAIL